MKSLPEKKAPQATKLQLVRTGLKVGFARLGGMNRGGN